MPPIGCDGCAVPGLAPAFIRLFRYWACGLGDVAEETDEESYDLVDGFGDRGKALCDGVAIFAKTFLESVSPSSGNPSKKTLNSLFLSLFLYLSFRGFPNKKWTLGESPIKLHAGPFFP